MTEPSTPAILIGGLVATALGPIVGPLALIAFGAFVGSLLAMAKAPTETKLQAVWFVIVGILIALVLTGAVAWALEYFFQIPSSVALMPIAAIIAAARMAILNLMDRLVDLFGSILTKKGG